MASEKAPQQAEIHFEGDSLQVLARFPDEIKRRLGFSLRQLQIGRLPTSVTRGMPSVGAGVFELKEADERTWCRTIYLSKVGNTIYCFIVLKKTAAKQIGAISKLPGTA